ncbi:leucyl aminopeptidase [Methylomarinum vadi]|uniref:leucyl aminopeptidase n=1 Tax=Methylomarinum vadi TaxID=438855 RepID=UPI0004DF7B1B|nr:leucyl aminopeptidase [Methylomarinum vadi]
MDYSIETHPLDKLESRCLIAGIYQNQQFGNTALTLDAQTRGIIGKVIKRGDIQGKNGETLLLNYLPECPIERVLLVGMGEKGKVTRKLYRKALTAAIKTVRESKLTSVTSSLHDIDVEDADLAWKTRQTIEVFNDGIYQYSHTKNCDENKVQLNEVKILAGSESQTAIETGLTQGLAIAQAMELTKRLADLPGNICTPSYLAEQAGELAEKFERLECEILEESHLEALGMGAFLAVSRGSRQPAKLITLNYRGGDEQHKPIVLVGKGLTFDAGGISLKPGAGMDEMKYDMCGGATVLGVLQAVAQMNLPLNVIGLIPSSENLPDGNANKPGDILTSMAGKTIEVLNTDAEGRLILCDTLTYAKKFDPEVVIDMATLTGACIVSLGRVPSGLLGNDDALCEDLNKASEIACDSVWRLPLWEEYQEQLKSNFADLANIGGPDAGTITAACFLSRFTEDYRWAHLDIAGTAWRTGQNKGATGRPVPLLTQYLLNRAHA